MQAIQCIFIYDSRWTPLQVSIVCIIEHTLLLLIFHTFLWIAFYSEDYNNLQFWHTVKSNMTNQTVKPNYFLSISSNWRFHIWWFGLVNLQLLIFYLYFITCRIFDTFFGKNKLCKGGFISEGFLNWSSSKPFCSIIFKLSNRKSIFSNSGFQTSKSFFCLFTTYLTYLQSYFSSES